MVWGLGFDILRSRSHSGGSSVKDLEKFELGFRVLRQGFGEV